MLNLSPSRKDLATLITEGNLKATGFLTPRVGTLCPFIRFRGGVPLSTKYSKGEAHLDNGEVGWNIYGDDGTVGTPLFGSCL